jgi:hypothetical protein
MKGKELKKSTVTQYQEDVMLMKFGELLYAVVKSAVVKAKATCKCDGGCGKRVAGDAVVYTHKYFSVCEECYDPEKDYDVSAATNKVTLQDVKNPKLKVTL